MSRLTKTIAGLLASLAVIAGAVAAVTVSTASPAPKPLPTATALWGS